MMHVIEMTDKEKLKMYMKCNKKELAKMLIECHKLIADNIHSTIRDRNNIKGINPFAPIITTSYT